MSDFIDEVKRVQESEEGVAVEDGGVVLDKTDIDEQILDSEVAEEVIKKSVIEEEIVEEGIIEDKQSEKTIKKPFDISSMVEIAEKTRTSRTRGKVSCNVVWIQRCS